MRVRSATISPENKSQQLLIYPQATKYQITQRDPLVTLFSDLGLSHIDPRLLGLNLLGYLAGYLGGKALRLPSGMERARTLEIGMQNAVLEALLSANLFGDAESLPPALYTFGCMATGTVLAQLGHRSK